MLGLRRNNLNQQEKKWMSKCLKKKMNKRSNRNKFPNKNYSTKNINFMDFPESCSMMITTTTFWEYWSTKQIQSWLRMTQLKKKMLNSKRMLLKLKMHSKRNDLFSFSPLLCLISLLYWIIKKFYIILFKRHW